MRTYHSSLDSLAFDLKKLERYSQRLKRYGYQIERFSDLAADPQRNQKTHELYCEVTLDIPDHIRSIRQSSNLKEVLGDLPNRCVATWSL